MSEKKKIVLVVDDVPDDIAILEEILKKEYQVKAVTNGEAALKVARGDAPPDLILLDIMMPGMDGFEVCRNLRQSAEGATIPVIFLTAKALNTDERLGFELGAVDYIKKPVDPEIVLSRIKAHLEQRDQAIRSSEVRFRRLFETSKDGIMMIDNGTGMIIDVNPAMSSILGLSQEDFLGKRAPELESLSNIVPPDLGFPASGQREYVRRAKEPTKTADGRTIYLEYVYNSYRVDHRDVTQLNIRDITNYVLAERERDALGARLSHYLSTSPTVTYSLRIIGGKAPMQWISENLPNILGYSTEEALEEGWWLRNVHTSDRMRAIRGISRIINGGSFAHDYRFYKKNREIVWLRDEMRFVASERGESEIVGTLTDVSDLKRVEADLTLNATALEAAANAIIICDRSGTVRWANPAHVKLTGITVAETIGKDIGMIAEALGIGSEVKGPFWDNILSGLVWHGEIQRKHDKDDGLFVDITITPVRDEAKRVSGFIGIMSDVSERKLAQSKLEVSLREKEVLLKEIHHRIKNNMQLITSLLNLSSQKIADPELLGILSGITRRISSIAAAHEQFYDAPDKARIDYGDYLKQLSTGLGYKLSRPSTEVSIVPHAEAVLLSLEQAIPAGLIASELLANAIEHGYPDKSSPGEVKLAIRRVGDSVELSVRDFGVGLPSGFDAAGAESLGMILVQTLAGQLQGTVEFRRSNGTEAILRFPAI